MSTSVKKYGQGEDKKGNKVSVAEMYSGPLPHPQMFKEYNDVIPGAGDVILNEFKAQGKHRRFSEKAVVIGKLYFGPLIALSIIVVALILGYLLIKDDKNIQGFGMIILPLAALGGLFVWNNRRDLERKK